MAVANIKLLIADDEAEIREGINRSIPWNENGIDVIGFATNGREALKSVRENEPDIMLLDIRMPIMNGLEVLEKLPLMEKIPKVVILSGFDDFNYCQQALRGGVSDYLLKPCRPNDILEVVNKLKDRILAEKSQELQLDQLRKQFLENIELLREKLLIYLVQNEGIDLDVGLVRWSLYQIEIAPQNIGVALIRIDNLKKLEYSSGDKLELVKLAVRNCIFNYLKQPPELPNIICDYNDDLLVLWNLSDEAMEPLSERLEAIRRQVASDLSFTVTIGMGEPAENLTKLYSAFNSALLAVQYSFWEGPNQIIWHNKVEEENSGDIQFSVQEENEIIQCIRTNDHDRLDPALESFFSSLTHPGRNSRDHIQKKVTALICSVHRVCVERGLSTDKYFGANLAILDELPKTETLNELKQKIHICLKETIEQHPSHKNQWKVVTNALKFMEEHYTEELSLESIAQKVFVSPGYLSTIFKQVLQKNFVDCLHEIRVLKAKELLRDFHAKIYEIAIEVGYKDEKYFSQIFKKITGMTPNQYRDTVQ